MSIALKNQKIPHCFRLRVTRSAYTNSAVRLLGSGTLAYNYPDYTEKDYVTRKVTSNSALLESDQVLWLDATLAPFTFTLSSAIPRPGRKIVLCRRNLNANIPTIAALPGQTIDGDSLFPLISLKQSLTLIADGELTWVIY